MGFLDFAFFGFGFLAFSALAWNIFAAALRARLAIFLACRKAFRAALNLALAERARLRAASAFISAATALATSVRASGPALPFFSLGVAAFILFSPDSRSAGTGENLVGKLSAVEQTEMLQGRVEGRKLLNVTFFAGPVNRV